MANAISPGLSVEIGEIDSRLGELWSASDAGKVRASLVNLVIYSESPDAITENTPLLEELAADHAFRALLVQADPHAGETDAKAWITAHCHLRESGGPKEVCSEQITFLLNGPAADRLSNIVFAHLDSDLPLCFWWQGQLHPEPDLQLWTRVDRLIIDSLAWTDPGSQFAMLRDIEAAAGGRCAVCDLNWTRLFHLRYAIAQIFDLQAARQSIPALESITIEYLSGCRITALELLGWIANRLGLRLQGAGTKKFFLRPDGGECRFVLRENANAAAAVASVEFALGKATASAKRSDAGDFYLVEFKDSGLSGVSQMLPAGREKISDILLAELGRVGRHHLYWPSIRAVEPLLSGF